MVQKKEKFMNLSLEYISTTLNYVFDSCLSVYSVSQTKPPADPAERERGSSWAAGAIEIYNANNFRYRQLATPGLFFV